MADDPVEVLVQRMVGAPLNERRRIARQVVKAVRLMDLDAARVDFLEGLLTDEGQQIALDRQELVPDEGGKSFLGITVEIGPRGDFMKFAGGAVDLRDAIDDAHEKRRTLFPTHAANDSTNQENK